MSVGEKMRSFNPRKKTKFISMVKLKENNCLYRREFSLTTDSYASTSLSPKTTSDQDETELRGFWPRTLPFTTWHRLNKMKFLN